MEIHRGTPVSPGVVIGPAFVLESEGARIPRKFIMPEEAPREVERFQKALGMARAELHDLQQRLTAEVEDGAGLVDIFRAHLHMIEDPDFHRRVVTHIQKKNFTPEYAVSEVLRRYVHAFERLGDAYMAQRKTDIYDIEHRLLNNLLGTRREDLAHLSQPVVIVAHNLTPSQTVAIDRGRALAFVTDEGGRTSHTAILARALSIPAVVGLGTITAEVSGGDEIIVDGSQGIVILGPDEGTIRRYRARERELATRVEQLTLAVHDLPCVTRDARRISLKANIEFPEEVTMALECGAEGIGLYRTEFLFHVGGAPPDEEEHYNAYLAAMRQLDGRPLTIRFLDIGADKFPTTADELNPFLGCRSIRILLRRPELLRTQLRAVLRASAHGKVRCMFPLVSTVHELREARKIVAEIKAELDDRGVKYDHDIEVGIMIEVPSAVMMAEALARECDFFSIGTNDLVQYTLAVDRDNAEVSELFTASDPSVLRLLAMTMRAAARQGIDCAICGEMAGDPLYTLFLIGIGLEEMSMGPKAIPELKRLIRAASYEEARQVAEHALTLETAEEVEQYLAQKTRETLPEVE